MAVAQITQLAHAMIAFEATRVGGPVSKELVELMGRASAAWAELTKRLMRQVQIAPPPIDNEIPDFLRRGPLPHIDEGATP